MVDLKLAQVGLDPAAFFKSAVMRAHRGAMEDVVRYWAKHMLPRHFEPGAASRYHYARRRSTSKRGRVVTNYPTRKRAVTGRDAPLQFTGFLKTMALAVGNQRARATRTRTRLVLRNLPPYTTMRRRNPNYPNVPQELTKVTRDEAKKLEEFYLEKARERLLADPRARKKGRKNLN